MGAWYSRLAVISTLRSGRLLLMRDSVEHQPVMPMNNSTSTTGATGQIGAALETGYAKHGKADQIATLSEITGSAASGLLSTHTSRGDTCCITAIEQ